MDRRVLDVPWLNQANDCVLMHDSRLAFGGAVCMRLAVRLGLGLYDRILIVDVHRAAYLALTVLFFDYFGRDYFLADLVCLVSRKVGFLCRSVVRLLLRLSCLAMSRWDTDR